MPFTGVGRGWFIGRFPMALIAALLMGFTGRAWAEDPLAPATRRLEIEPHPVRIPGAMQRITSVAFSPDGKVIAAGHGWWEGEGLFQLWDVASRTRLAQRRMPIGSPGVGWTNGTNRLVVADWQAAVRIFDHPSLEERAVIKIDQSVARFAVSPDGKQLVTAAEGHSDRDDSLGRVMQIWNADTGELVRTCQSDESLFRLGCTAWSPKGTYVAAAGGSYGRNEGLARVWSAKTGEEVSRMEGHTGFVRAVRFFPEEDRLITCGLDNTLRIWDVKSGKQRSLLQGNSLLDAADVAPDGSLVAAAGYNGLVVLWDAATLEKSATLGPMGTPLHTVAFSPDGRRLATGGDDGVIRLWNVAERTREAELPESNSLDRPGTPTVVVASPDGRVAYVAYSTGRLSAFDVTTQKRLWTHSLAAGRSPTALVADQSRLVTGTSTGAVQIRDAANGKVLKELAPLASAAMSAVFSADGAVLALGDGAGRISIRETATDAVRAEFQPHAAAVLAMSFAPDGQTLASIAADGTAMWSGSASGKVLHVLALQVPGLRTVRFSADGSTFLVVGQQLSVWDSRQRTRQSMLDWDSPADAAAITSDGSHVAITGSDGLALFDSRTGQMVKAPTALRRPRSTCLAFTPDDRRLFQGESGGELAVWRTVLPPRSPLVELRRVGNAVAVATSPDGKWLAAGGDDSQASVWNMETGELVHMLPVNGVLYACQFSADSQWLATGSLQGMVKVWGLKEGSLEASFFESPRGIRSLAFSPDGRWLATGGNERLLRVIDTRSWEVVHQQPDQPLSVEGLAFSPDGQSLYSLTGSWDAADHPVTARLTHWKVSLAGNPAALTLTPVKRIDAHAGTADGVAVANDGKWVLTASGDGNIRVWDAATLDPVRSIATGESVHRIHVLKGDPPRALAGGYLGSVSVWDLATGDLIAPYAGHTSHVFDVTATPDNRLLISASEDDRLLFWPGPTQGPDAKLNAFLKRILPR